MIFQNPIKVLSVHFHEPFCRQIMKAWFCDGYGGLGAIWCALYHFQCHANAPEVKVVRPKV